MAVSTKLSYSPLRGKAFQVLEPNKDFHQRSSFSIAAHLIYNQTFQRRILPHSTFSQHKDISQFIASTLP